MTATTPLMPAADTELFRRAADMRQGSPFCVERSGLGRSSYKGGLSALFSAIGGPSSGGPSSHRSCGSDQSLSTCLGSEVHEFNLPLRSSQPLTVPTSSRCKEKNAAGLSFSATSRTPNQSCSPKLNHRLLMGPPVREASAPVLGAERYSLTLRERPCILTPLNPTVRSVGFVPDLQGACSLEPIVQQQQHHQEQQEQLPAPRSSLSSGRSSLASALSRSVLAQVTADAASQRINSKSVFTPLHPECLLNSSQNSLVGYGTRSPFEPLSDRGLGKAREQILRMVETANGVKYSRQEELLRNLREKYPVFNHQLVKRACDVAAMAHEGQSRKNGDPMIIHCLETARILAEIGASPKLVAVGLLHDTLDDSVMTQQQLRHSFGDEISALVENVSQLSSMSQKLRDAEGALSQAEEDRLARSGRALTIEALDRARRMILSAKDVSVVIVKLADRIHNLRTLSALPPPKRRRIASESLELWAPLASRLGVWAWKAEIEDICFRELWPGDHAELAAAVASGGSSDESVFEAVGELHAGLIRAGVGYCDLHGRSKNLFSIFQKMKSKGKTLAEVFDQRGIRLIVPDEDSCYRALDVVRSIWSDEKTEQFKDYIRRPKGNGYQSIHVVVHTEDGRPLEVQIRSEEMHKRAEYGVAAHWRYKEKRGKDLASSTGNANGSSSSGTTTASMSSSSSGTTTASMSSSSSSSSRSLGSGDWDEDEPGDQWAADRRLEWQRYCMSWVAEYTDKKIRLSAELCGPTGSRVVGSSPRSSRGINGVRQLGFPSVLAAHTGSCPGGRGDGGHRPMCTFPEHAEGCCFRADSGVVGPPLPDSEPLLVILVVDDRVDVVKLRVGSTRESFLREFLERSDRPHLLHRARLIINSELVPVTSDRLSICDVIEVVVDLPADARSPSRNSLGNSSLEHMEEDEFVFVADDLEDAAHGALLGRDGGLGEGDLLPVHAPLPESAGDGVALAREFHLRCLSVPLEAALSITN